MEQEQGPRARRSLPPLRCQDQSILCSRTYSGSLRLLPSSPTLLVPPNHHVPKAQSHDLPLRSLPQKSPAQRGQYQKSFVSVASPVPVIAGLFFLSICLPDLSTSTVIQIHQLHFSTRYLVICSPRPEGPSCEPRSSVGPQAYGTPADSAHFFCPPCPRPLSPPGSHP